MPPRQIPSLLLSWLIGLVRFYIQDARESWWEGELRKDVGLALVIVSATMFLWSSAAWATDGGGPITSGTVASMITLMTSAGTAVYAFAILRADVQTHERRLKCLDGGSDPEKGLPVRLARIEQILEERLPPAPAAPKSRGL